MNTLEQELQLQAAQLQLPTNFKCRIATDVLLLEAEELLQSTYDHEPELSKYGLASDAAQKLMLLIKLTREAHLNKIAYRNEYQEEWSVFKTEFRSVYHDTIKCLKFALFGNEAIQKRLLKMNKESTYLALSLRMEELALLVKEHQHKLQALGINHLNAEALSTMSNKCSQLRANIQLSDQTQLTHTKNKYYYLLYSSMREIRRIGQFAFRNHPEQQKSYTSKSIRSKNLKHRNKSKRS